MQFSVIYADPPYTFNTYSPKGSGRGAISHYNLMSFEQLCAYPVGDLAAPDCALFLWVPGPHTEQGFALMRAWGFTFKGTAFVWAKLNPKALTPFMGCGYGTRKNAEICWLATRGNPKRLNADVRELVLGEELIVDVRRQHSQKPDRIRTDIERLFPGPYCELFARSTTPGWTCLGNEVGLLDHGPVETRRQPSDLTS
jgi:N6-adenosine-specific RNA methylase IME4